LAVGASSGIGRALAVRAGRAGAEVVLVARRHDELAAAAAAAGSGLPVAADISEALGRARVLAAASDGAPIDLVLYSAGYAELRDIDQIDAAAWQASFEVNVIALNELLNGLVSKLAPGAIVAVVSSETVTRPWAGLAAYAASKAALDTSLRFWQLEHPEVRFTGLTLGPTQPTGFGADFDAGQLGRHYQTWERHGRLQEDFMNTDELADVVVSLLAAALVHPGVGIEQVVLRSPSPVKGNT
jgi:NAD(P)-dependent dehydrogenase (short-subunit alcohol dehydrogenase family)